MLKFKTLTTSTCPARSAVKIRSGITLSDVDIVVRLVAYWAAHANGRLYNLTILLRTGMISRQFVPRAEDALDTRTATHRNVLPRGVFLGYQQYGDSISVTERPGVIELRETLSSRLILAAFVAGMLYVLVMILYVEGWTSFYNRVPAYPAIGAAILSGLTFALCLERTLRRRTVCMRFDTREIVFHSGWIVRRAHRFAFSQISDIRLDQVTVFRPSHRPTMVPVLVVQWLSGEKGAIAISNNHEKLNYLKERLESACSR